jgi:N-methylhydantoinase B/oxoprolinase/acetone carboxylase alpha subunit
MKKLIAFLTIVLCFSMTTLMAQGGGGGQRMTPEERKAQLIERLKPLNLTQVQTDSVVAIYIPAAGGMGMANMRDMSPEDRQAAMKAMADERTKRLEKALGADLAKKVADLMPQRRGPGGGGGGGK